MTAKQLKGTYAKDGSKYGTITDSAGTYIAVSTSTTTTKQNLLGSQAPDGSIYFTLTDGQGSLV